MNEFWLGIAAAVLTVAWVIAAICKEIAARWRGIVVAHLFFLTLWMAIQVFFFATGAHWCLPGDSSRFVRWLTASFSHVSRCGPASAPTPYRGAAIAASAAAPAPPPPAVVPVAPRTPSFGLSASVRPPPAAGAASTSGAASGWSAKTIANCWRNRAVDGGDCYDPADPRRRPSPPPRYRYRYTGAPPSPRPCRRLYDCRPDSFWRNDDL